MNNNTNKANNPMKVITGPDIRWSYANVWEAKSINDMSVFLQEQPTALTEYNEALVRRLIEKVIVYEDKFIVEFKSGVTMDVNE